MQRAAEVGGFPGLPQKAVAAVAHAWNVVAVAPGDDGAVLDRGRAAARGGALFDHESPCFGYPADRTDPRGVSLSGARTSAERRGVGRQRSR
eukprot:8073788-Pyramimonas_sp.AAC.1